MGCMIFCIHMKFISIVFTKDRGGNGMAHILYLEDDRVIREVVCEYLLLQHYEVDLALSLIPFSILTKAVIKSL